MKIKPNFNVKSIALMLGLLVALHVSAQKKKISCVGNSITYGYELPSPSTQSYPGQMQVLLGAGWEVGNFGSSGRSMLKGGGYSYWDDQRYKDALASKPDFIMIELGTNDSKNWLWDWKGTEFKGDYKAMVQSFQNLSSKPEIWVGLLIPGDNAGWGIFNSYIKDKVNPKIKEVALEMGLNLIDLYAELDKHKPEWYLADNIHPSVEGAGVIARKVKEMLVMAKPVAVFTNGKLIAPNGFDYQWYLDGAPIAVALGGNKKELVVTKPGNYKVSVKLNADTETWVVSKEVKAAPVSIPPVDPKTQVIGTIVYPSPVTDVVYVQSDNLKAISSYRVTNLSGRKVLSGSLSVSNDVGSINVSSLASGTYVLLLGNERIKFIKAK